MVGAVGEMRKSLYNNHIAYVQSGCWKCPDSPSGAHHWIEKSHATLPGVFYCKWCYEVKEFPVTLTTALRHSGIDPSRPMDVSQRGKYPDVLLDTL